MRRRHQDFEQASFSEVFLECGDFNRDTFIWRGVGNKDNSTVKAANTATAHGETVDVNFYLITGAEQISGSQVRIFQKTEQVRVPRSPGYRCRERHFHRRYRRIPRESFPARLSSGRSRP